MIASIPIISPIFQGLLNTIGWILAEIYKYIPNYGIAIIILTLLIKIVLLPLGVKQIKSMQTMQAIQPRIKEINKKYKADKAKAQEETMKLYKEAGVNPLGGCLPLLLQFPILISMYAVIRMPMLQASPNGSKDPTAYIVQNNHLPIDSRLFSDVITHQNTGLLIVNLQCSAAQSGSQAYLSDTSRDPVISGKPLYNGRYLSNGDISNQQPIPNLTSSSTLDCGKGVPSKIPYFVLLALMIATTFYQQRQMQKASPPGATSGQQQTIMKLMPIMFGVFGFAFPAGLVVYWTVSNIFQIGQQSYLMRAGHIGPEALDKRMAEQRAKNVDQPVKKGWMARMMEQAQQQERSGGKGTGKSSGTKPTGRSPGKTPGKSGGSSGRSTGGRTSTQPKPSGSSGSSTPKRRPNVGGNKPGGSAKPAGPKKRPGGGSDGEVD
jgi:YidC/Oxa1 family membrane protein insertase